MEKKVLILANHVGGLYNFRRELIPTLRSRGYIIYVSCPYNKLYKENIENLTKEGCNFIWTDLTRREINPILELQLLYNYSKMIKNINPDVILGYTIKPNIYGSLVARIRGKNFIANITGMGSAIKNAGFFQKLIVNLYRFSFSKVHTVFFQNKENRDFFIKNKIVNGNDKLLPGSGVNLKYHEYQNYPSREKDINFIFMSRVMEEKGANQYLEAAKYITNKYPNIRFHICGNLQENYKEILEEYEAKNIITYHGRINDIRKVLKHIHATILPSFHEGMSNTLLESAANGRPILASNIPGCQETFDEGVSGYGFEPKDTESLIRAIEKFLELSYDEKEHMGLAGRKKMEKEFDRQIVVDKYLQVIESI